MQLITYNNKGHERDIKTIQIHDNNEMKLKKNNTTTIQKTANKQFS